MRPDMRGNAGFVNGDWLGGIGAGIAGDGLAEAVPVGWRGGAPGALPDPEAHGRGGQTGCPAERSEATPNGKDHICDVGLTGGSPGLAR